MLPDKKAGWIAISATNPCHLYEMALELHRLQALDCYYSGYPGWRLKPPRDFPLWTCSLKTVVVYGTLKLVPKAFQPPAPKLFRWQDKSFDMAVARVLRKSDVIHAMPGQCFEIFRAAVRMGMCTVLNHATGPVRRQLALLSGEYRRFGLKQEQFHSFDEEYAAREKEEYAMADLHCVASNLVKKQLVEEGVDAGKISVVPYGADAGLYHPGTGISTGPFKIIFAGQVGLRKGIHHLLEALQSDKAAGWELDCYGAIQREMEGVLPQYKPRSEVRWHGPVSRGELAGAYRAASVLVLPSIEEGFGLVVPQALASGIPCIVSEGVGARDLIRHRENGSIVPVGNVEAILEELIYWSNNRKQVKEDMNWGAAARKIMQLGRGGVQ